MKSFSQFLKEEIDLRGNQGIPDDFMSSAERQARTNLGVNIDDPRQLGTYGPQIGRLIAQSQQIMNQGLNREQLRERKDKLEKLAYDIVMSEYSEILEASEKPVELIIKFVEEGQVNQEIPEMGDIPSFPDQEEINDPELRKAVDKKKILNAINQGEAKATKNIIQFSDLVKPGLEEIFGNRAEEILKIWLDTTDIANKLDWVFPLEMKSRMMKDVPQGMAGACQVKWEKNEEESQEEEQEEKSYQDEDGTVMTGDQEDFDKITIKAVGIDFPMLIHEAVKGIWSLIKSGAIKEDEELAQLIAKNTSSYEDEAQDFRYGVALQAMLRDFINACKDANKYSQMTLRIYGRLANDKDRDGEFTDGEFLELTKEIFSTFDLVQEENLEFKLNTEKFNASTAKRKIEALIAKIVDAEKEYEEELSKWEMEQKFGGSTEEETYSDEDEEDFNDYLSGLGISKAKDVETTEEEEEDDVDTLLDKLSTAKTEEEKSAIKKKLDKLTESLSEDGKRIYGIEIERILEATKYHVRRK
jgi:hypothetical protein